MIKESTTKSLNYKMKDAGFATENHGIPQIIDGHRPVTLTDAMIALKALAGVDTSGLISSDHVAFGAYVNGDNNGYEEINA